jgi:hypothetical protein
MKKTIFWGVMLCTVVELDRGLRRAYCPRPLTHRPDDGNSKHLRNVGVLLQEYTAEYPRKMTYR